MTKTKCTVSNENYFETINEKSAYALGIMYSDGWVSKNNSVNISQSIENSEILDFFYKELGFYGFYYLAPQKIQNKVRYYPTISFTSVKMIKDLKKYGIIPNKTDKIVLPTLKSEYMRYLLLGIFDGDGCIHFSGKNTVFNIAGTKDSIISIYKYFNNIGINVKYAFVKGQTWLVYCYKKEEIKKIYELFYKDSYLGMSRKKQTFEDILDNYGLLESPETKFEFDYSNSKHEYNSYLIGSILGNANFLSPTRIIINKGSKDELEFVEKVFDKYMTPTTRNIIKDTVYKLTYRSNKLFKYLYDKMFEKLDQSIINRINNYSLGMLYIQKGFIENDKVVIKNVKYTKHDNERISAFVRKKYKIVFNYNEDLKQWIFDEENSTKFLNFIKEVTCLNSNYKTN
jgi:hypothetical protein